MKITLSVCFNLLFFILFQLLAKPVYASDFAVDRTITYTIDNDLIANVQEEITIENLLTEKYPQTYTLEIVELDILNLFAQNATGNKLDWNVEQKTKSGLPLTEITVQLTPPVLGKGRTYHLNLYYELMGAVKDEGQTKEIKLPKLLPNSLDRKVDVVLMIRNSLGEPAYILPQPENKQIVDDWQLFHIPANGLRDVGLKTVFGNFQIYDFKLRYFLPKNSETNFTHIAWPPKTPYQNVSITSVSEDPVDVDIDPDGNWLAKYALSNTSKTIEIQGSVMVFSAPQNYLVLRSETNDLSKWLLPQKFWEADSPKILDLVKDQASPEKIYDYVTNNFQYDYQYLGDEATRKGAVKALDSPTKAICMDFTDTFIAFARASKIPARQAIGYAYSDNSISKPLSLLADVLHSWPEYWNPETQLWQPTDPTWGVTTGGVNYFDNWDLNHVVLVFNGINSELPLPAGFYKQENEPLRDIDIKIGEHFSNEQPEVTMNLNLTYPWWPFGWWHGDLIVKNKNSLAYDVNSLSLSETIDLIALRDTDEKFFSVPPYGKEIIGLKIKSKELFWLGNKLLVNINDSKVWINIPKYAFIWQAMILFVTGGICVTITYKGIKIAKKLWGVSV